jgi:hypothetical protein
MEDFLMAIDFLASEIIIPAGDKQGNLTVKIETGATHYRISKRKFFQFGINISSVPMAGMKKIPEGAEYAQIQATGNMYHMDYEVSFD